MNRGHEITLALRFMGRINSDQISRGPPRASARRPAFVIRTPVNSAEKKPRPEVGTKGRGLHLRAVRQPAGSTLRTNGAS